MSNHRPENKYLVGLLCYNHPYGCNCNANLAKEEIDTFIEKYGDFAKREDYCYLVIIYTDNPSDAYEKALRQQGATEYENAKELWGKAKLICEYNEDWTVKL